LTGHNRELCANFAEIKVFYASEVQLVCGGKELSVMRKEYKTPDWEAMRLSH